MYLFNFSQKNKLGFSRTHIQNLILKKEIRVKDIDSLKPNYKIKKGDEIIANIIDKKSGLPLAEDIRLDIVYDDKDLALINKPCGIVVHPAPGNYQHTLVNALLHHFKKLSDINPQRPGIVHRLDKDTSGLLVIAKNNNAHLALAKQFAEHSIKRVYTALVKGRVEFNENIIEMPIGRNPLKRKSMSVGFGKDSKYAKTRYRVIRRKRDCTLVDLEPFTGRTHQLRVHLDYLGYPILGDTKYGKNNKFKRLALHARSIGFVHPSTKKFIEFNVDIPQEFTDFIDQQAD
ncbi:MAG: RluA family pseudouridine synthase [Candidatus Omnitrophota bacterium]